MIFKCLSVNVWHENAQFLLIPQLCLGYFCKLTAFRRQPIAHKSTIRIHHFEFTNKCLTGKINYLATFFFVLTVAFATEHFCMNLFGYFKQLNNVKWTSRWTYSVGFMYVFFFECLYFLMFIADVPILIWNVPSFRESISSSG